MVDLFIRGGPVMWPLLLCALLGVAFVFERYIVLSKIPAGAKAEKELETAENILAREGEEAVAKHCSKGRGVLNYIFSALLKRYDAIMIERREFASRKKEILVGETRDESGLSEFMARQQELTEMRDELMAEVDDAAAMYLGKWFAALTTIGNVSPLLGLQGTILGMIIAFDSIAKSGTGDPRVVASGISQALITTAAGLFIAIPVIVFHRYLIQKATRGRDRIEVYAHAFITTLMTLEEKKESV